MASQAIAHDQMPFVSEDGDLLVPTHGAYLSETGSVITVKRKRAVVIETPFDRLSSVTVEASGVAVSSELLAELSARRVPVLICRLSGLPVARMVPARSWMTASVAEEQLRARIAGRGAGISIGQ